MKNLVKWFPNTLEIYTLLFGHWCFVSNSQYSAEKNPNNFDNSMKRIQ